MHPRTRARLVALRSLAQLEASERPLNAVLEGQEAGVESLGFARELASGATRWRSRLDWTLAPLLKKPIEKLDAPVRAALRLALYERIVLQTPASAIANEYAGLMREVKLKSAVAFVNAITRRIPGTWRESPDREKSPARFLSVETAHPEWMVARWIDRLGFDEAAALCHANNEVAPLDLRVNTTRASREQVLEALQARGIKAQPTPLSPHGIRVVRAAREEGSERVADDLSPWRWPEWESGWLLAQDEAAQLVALTLISGPNGSLLDMASAPGGKATHLAELMLSPVWQSMWTSGKFRKVREAMLKGSPGFVLAADRSTPRLARVRENAQRLGLANMRFFEGEARQVLEAVQSGELKPFKTVLLDAPCSGTGTLRRRPDAKWRKSPQNLAQLVGLQAEMLDIAAQCVRPDGVLCYSTCSLEDEENLGSVRDFLLRHPDWHIGFPEPWLLEVGVSESLEVAGFEHDGLPGAIATSPARHGCDGMFCAYLCGPEWEDC